MSSRRSGRTSGPSIDVRADSFLDDEDEPMPASTKQRQAARGSNRGRPDPFEGGEIIHGKRDRGGKKSYVVESSPDDDEDDEDEEEEAQIEVVDDEDEDMEDAEEDAEGEEEVDMDAEGDVDMDIPAPSSGPTIKISRNAAKPSTTRNQNEEEDEDDDDDDLSDPGDSDAGDQTLGFGDETGLGEDEDAEGDEIEVAGEMGDRTQGGDSDDDGSQDGEVDLGKMTKRQRARFEDGPQDFMKLSDGALKPSNPLWECAWG
jgi:Ino eighty subunit 2